MLILIFFLFQVRDGAVKPRFILRPIPPTKSKVKIVMYLKVAELLRRLERLYADAEVTGSTTGQALLIDSSSVVHGRYTVM